MRTTMTTQARVPGEIAAEIGTSPPSKQAGNLPAPPTPHLGISTVIVLLLNLMPRSRARANGTTTTFRRPSLATNLSHQRETSQTNPSAANQNTGVYVPPHMNSSYQTSFTRGAPSETRYSKDQLLDLFRAQREGPTSAHVSDLYVDGWHPSSANGMTNGGWSRKDELKEGSAASEMCWDHEGKVQPLALSDMTEQEKEVCYFWVSVKSQQC